MTDTEQTETTTTGAPEAPTTPQPEQPETFTREYVESLRKENASYRTKAKEAQEAAQKAKTDAERQKLDEVERLKAEKADAEKAAQDARDEAAAAKRERDLTGKVADPAAALKLLDPEAHLNDDGTVNTEALLASYPFLAPPEAKRVDLPGQKTLTGAGRTVATLQEQLKNARSRAERISIQRQIHEAQKGK